MPDIANIVRSARLTAGISQGELATRIEADQSVISRFEHGQRTPNLEMLAKIAEALNMKLRIAFEVDPKSRA